MIEAQTRSGIETVYLLIASSMSSVFHVTQGRQQKFYAQQHRKYLNSSINRFHKSRHTSCSTHIGMQYATGLRVHSRAITTVSRVVHSGVGGFLKRRHVYTGSVGRVSTVVLVLRIVLDRVMRWPGSGVCRSIVADRKIVRRSIVVPDRVRRIVRIRRRFAEWGSMGSHLAVRRPAGPNRVPVNMHVVIHVRLLVPEIYGKRWAT